MVAKHCAAVENDVTHVIGGHTVVMVTRRFFIFFCSNEKLIRVFVLYLTVICFALFVFVTPSWTKAVRQMSKGPQPKTQFHVFCVATEMHSG